MVFEKKNLTEKRMLVLFFPTNFVRNILIVRRILLDIIINVRKFSRKVTVILIRF